MAKHCMLCTKKILSHSKILKCMVCSNEFHIACCNISRKELPDISHDWYCTSCVENSMPFYNIREDDEFKSAIYSLHSDNPIDVSVLDELAFNPFDWNHDNNTHLSDLDPDIQFFSST